MSDWADESDNREYVVVLNIHRQYSIWPAHKDVPAGWEVVGERRSKAECLEYIGEVWTDITPSYAQQAPQA